MYRILRVKYQYGLTDKYIPEIDDAEIGNVKQAIGSKENHDIEWKIANDSVTLLKNNDVLPLSGNERIIYVLPYSSHNNSVIYAEQLLRQQGFNLNTSQKVIFTDMQPAEADSVAANVDVVIAVSALYETAELNPYESQGIQTAFLKALLSATHNAGGKFILISSQLPYDVSLFMDADAILACYNARGMSIVPTDFSEELPQFGPNIPAAIYTLFGAHNPNGKLPVSVPYINADYTFSEQIAYNRGWGLSYKDYSDKNAFGESFDSDKNTKRNKDVLWFSEIPEYLIFYRIDNERPVPVVPSFEN